MKLLFTSTSAESHLRTLLPVVQAAVAAGHEVRLAAPADLARVIEALGVRHVEAGIDLIAAAPPAMASMMAAVRDDPAAMTAMMREPKVDVVNTVMASPEAAVPLARDVLEHGERWRPDALVRTASEMGGALAAEVWGIPQVMVATGAALMLDFDVAARTLEPARAALGLAPASSAEWLVPDLTAALMPDAWALPKLRGRVEHYQHTNIRTDSVLDARYASADGARPFVFAALGTQAGRGHFAGFSSGLLRAVIAGLGRLDCDAVVAVGAQRDPEAFGPAPANVTLVKVAPQQQLLGGCDLFVTHGGFNSIRESVRAGTPVLVTPLFGDQPVNAERCAEFGFGQVLDVDGITADAVADAVRTALATPSLGWRARAWQRRMLSLPPLEALVSDVEKLVVDAAVTR